MRRAAGRLGVLETQDLRPARHNRRKPGVFANRGAVHGNGLAAAGDSGPSQPFQQPRFPRAELPDGEQGPGPVFSWPGGGIEDDRLTDPAVHVVSEVTKGLPSLSPPIHEPK